MIKIPEKKTILYVDDDSDDLAMFQEAVEVIGSDYTIVEAFDGEHALEILERMKQSDLLPCLIVLDINMPRMDGKRTLVTLQQDSKLAEIPVVMFSTSSSLLDKTFCELRKVELITKPIKFENLFKITHKLLSYCKV